MIKKTYIDSSILISAFQGIDDVSNRAMKILDDPNRIFVVSDYLVLEVLPHPTFLKRRDEINFMETTIRHASEKVESSPKVTEIAINVAAKYDITAMDALHVGAAIKANVDELVTMERQTSPLCRVQEIRVVSLHINEDQP